jgi:phage-related protein
MREPGEWKMIFMSAYRQETNVVAGINGELINLSLSTSELTKQEFSELLEFIQAQGAEWGVQWSDPALKVFESYREAQAA